MWDPAQYLRYADERSRPFSDLVARIGAARPRSVVDLGCGPGHLTAALAARWPQARVLGIDSAPEMIREARAAAYPITFRQGDLRRWSPEEDTDVVVSNAALQWVDHHEDLLAPWVAALPAGAWLAVQVPGNHDAPSHQALRALVAEIGSKRPGLVERLPAPVPDAVHYAEILVACGCRVDAWETTYVHRLPAAPDGEHPVLAWMEGTTMRPVRATLDAKDWNELRARLRPRLGEAYPLRNGAVAYPFRRVFFVARKDDTEGDDAAAVATRR